MTRLLVLLALLLLALPARADCDRERTAAMRAESSDAAYALAIGAWGLCAEKAGTYGEAHRLVSRALEGAPPGTSPAAPWPALRAALRRLDDRVARVLVTFDGDLWIDGHAVVAVSGAVLAVDPGRHVFEARGKGHVAKEVEARAGDLPTVDLRGSGPRDATAIPSQTATAAPVSSPGVSSPFAPALTPRGVVVSVAYASLGVAVASGIAALVLEGGRSTLASGLAPDACPTPDASTRCAELAQVFQQRTAARNVAIVAGAVGLAGVGVAVGLYFAGERAPSSGVITVGGLW